MAKVEDRGSLTGPSEPRRIQSLDIFRGLAICGVLLVHMTSFGAVPGAYDFPPLGGWSSADRIVWWIDFLFVEGAMRGLLSMLFGATFVLLTSGEDQSITIADRYYRRTIWLFLFGIAHSYFLLMPEDILIIYGAAGLFLFPWRHAAPRALLVAGMAAVAVLTLSGGVELAGKLSLADAAQETAARLDAGEPARRQDADILKAWSRAQAEVLPDPQAVKAMLAARLGDFKANFKRMGEIADELNTAREFGWYLVDALALMLVGAAFMKWGILQGKRPWGFYLRLMLAGYAIGLPLNFLEALQLYASDFSAVVRLETLTYEISRLAVTVGHVGLLHLVLRNPAMALLFQPFAALGRMALSNYLGHTLICQWLLFPGFGFALAGRFGLATLWMIALGIIVFQLVASRWWLARFRFGPFEWLWRSLALGRSVPLRWREGKGQRRTLAA